MFGQASLRNRAVVSVMIVGFVLAAALSVGLPGGIEEAAAAKRCGTTTVSYSYGSFRFRVSVGRGRVSCETARRVMRVGIPATRPDPRGWYCRRTRPSSPYSDVCLARGRLLRARLV